MAENKYEVLEQRIDHLTDIVEKIEKKIDSVLDMRIQITRLVDNDESFNKEIGHWADRIKTLEMQRNRTIGLILMAVLGAVLKLVVLQ